MTTNSEGRVTQVQLQDYGLDAKDLPAELASLGALEVLDLRDNNIAIPVGLDVLDITGQMHYTDKERSQRFLQHLALSAAEKAAKQATLAEAKKYGPHAHWLRKLFNDANGKAWRFNREGKGAVWFGEEKDIGKWAGIETAVDEEGGEVRVVSVDLSDKVIGDVGYSGVRDLNFLGFILGSSTITEFPSKDFEWVKSCSQLTDVSALGSCSSLHTLNLGWCSALVKMPDLSSNEELKVEYLPHSLSGWKEGGFKASMTDLGVFGS